MTLWLAGLRNLETGREGEEGWREGGREGELVENYMANDGRLMLRDILS